MTSTQTSSIDELRKRIQAIQSSHFTQKGCGSEDSLPLPDTENKEAKEVFKYLLTLIRYRDRSSAELRKRLIEKEWESSAIEEAIFRAQRSGIIDDQRFGLSLIHARVNAKKGQRGIEQELEKHEINPCTLPGWPEEFFPSEYAELQKALSILEKRPPKAKNKRNAAYQKLISNGYSSSIAATAAQKWSANKLS